MITVRSGEGIESMINRFRKQCNKAGLFEIMQERQAFVPAREKERQKRYKARKRRRHKHGKRN